MHVYIYSGIVFVHLQLLCVLLTISLNSPVAPTMLYIDNTTYCSTIPHCDVPMTSIITYDIV